MSTQDTIDQLIASPATSNWLRDSLAAALKRDCVDAANDAELLNELLSKRCAEMLGQMPT
jgi:hypothetical protein